MFVLYPYDEKAALLDRQFHVGLGILVAAIHKPRLTTISLYLPEARWYDYHTYTEVESGPITYNLSQYYVPSFIKGGYIIPRQDKARSCTRDMLNDPYTLIIALDEYERAFGKLYIDDTQSFRYQNGEFIYADLSYQCKEIRYELKN